MKVTLTHLKQLRACINQVNLFQATFGEEVEVTEENCVLAAKAGIDIYWAAGNLLTKPQRKAYETAEAHLWEAYKTAVAPQREAYETAKAVEFYKATLIKDN